MDVTVAGLGTANPPLRLPQAAIYEAYTRLWPLSAEARAFLRRVMVENRSIAHRYLAMDDLTDALRHSQDDLIARYRRFAVPLAAEAAHLILTGSVGYVLGRRADEDEAGEAALLGDRPDPEVDRGVVTAAHARLVALAP